MMGYLDSVETFFFYLGWGSFFLGLCSCLFPRCFKKSVLLMLAGDVALMFAILFPKAFVGLAVFSLSFSYKAIGIFVALIFWGISVGPSLICLGKCKNVKPCHSKKQAQVKSADKAPPSLFSNVRRKTIAPAQENINLFAGIDERDR